MAAAAPRRLRLFAGAFMVCGKGDRALMSDLLRFGRAYDFHEIVADGVVHGVGIVFALIGATALIFYATLWSSHGELFAAWTYGIGLVLCLSVSFTYNIWPHSRTKWLLRRFDHSAIFVLIAATYTPFLERGSSDPLVFAMLIFVWAVALFGITLKCVFPGRFDRLTILLYLGMGWSGVVVISPLSQQLPSITLWLIVAGGIIYSLGVIFHVWERLRFQNAIWHAFVIAAAAVHYSAVVTCFSLPSPSI
jgi:hemolysin III